MIYTFGHGTLDTGAAVLERLAWLPNSKQTTIIDIRSHPESRWDLWNLSNEHHWIPQLFGGFRWIKELGAWRAEHAAQADLVDFMWGHGDVDVTAYAGRFPTGLVAQHLPGYDDPATVRWTVKGFADYQWFMYLEEFQQAAWDLASTYGDVTKPDAALFCGETLWWKCHRSMLADYLGLLGVQVFHLNGRTKTPHVRHGWQTRIDRYDQEVLDAWDHFKVERMAPA